MTKGGGVEGRIVDRHGEQALDRVGRALQRQRPRCGRPVIERRCLVDVAPLQGRVERDQNGPVAEVVVVGAPE
jgi:hypothetical protein